MTKILIIAPSWVGDCMLMQPMLARLKLRYPECSIDVFAPSWVMGLLESIPEVNHVIPNPFSHGQLLLGARYQFGKKLRASAYDIAIVLPNSLKSALVPFFARISIRTGFVGESRYGLLNDLRKLNKKLLPLMVERFSQLAEPKSVPITQPTINPQLTVTEIQRTDVLNKFGLELTRPVVALCPGAEFGPAKRWPTPYFAELALRLHESGYQIWIIGSGKDRVQADEICSLLSIPFHNLCGQTNLNEAISLIASAQLVICNDSGLMHISAALNRPLIALFGSSSPQFTPPLSRNAHVMQLGLKCSPCFKRECPLGHFNCMIQLTPNLVLDKIQELHRIDN